MTSQPLQFSNQTSLVQAYQQDVRRELMSRLAQKNWFEMAMFIQRWLKRCDDHIAAHALKPMLERAEEQFRLARNNQPYLFEG